MNPVLETMPPIGLVALLVAALHLPLGSWMYRVFTDPTTGASSGPSTAPSASTPTPTSAGSSYALSVPRLRGRVGRHPLRPPRGPALAAAQPGPVDGLAHRLEHRRLVHHQHELAELRRRDRRRAMLVQMTGLDGAELRLRRPTGLAVAIAADPRVGEDRQRPARQLLGGPGPRHHRASCCPSPPAARGRPHRRRRHAEPRRAAHRSRPSPVVTRRCRRARRLAGGDQGARAPTAAGSSTPTRPTRSRTPTAHEPPRDRPAAVHPVRAAARCSASWSATAAGHRVTGVMAALWVASSALTTWAELSAASGPTGGHGGQGSRFGPAARRSSPPRPPARRPAPSTPRTTRSRPLGGRCALPNMLLGEVRPGGVGSGLYGMLVFAVLTVFIAGLMVGRTPELSARRSAGARSRSSRCRRSSMPALVLVGTGRLARACPRSRAPRWRNPGRTGCPRCSTPRVRGQQQRLGLRGLSATPLSQTSAGRGDVARPVRCRSCWPRAGRALGRAEPRPATAGTLPTHTPAVRRAARRRRPHRRRAHVLPRARARSRRGGTVMTTVRCSSDVALGAALPDALRKLDPRAPCPHARDVRRVGGLGRHHASSRPCGPSRLRDQRSRVWLWATVLFANLAEAVAEGRGKAQADALRRTPHRDRRAPAAAPTGRGAGARHAARGRGPRRRRGGRDDPGRRRRRRGRRLASTSRRSPASRPPSSASPAATAPPSPAARRVSPTGSSCASRPSPGETFIDRMIAPRRGRRPAEDAERDRARRSCSRGSRSSSCSRGHARSRSRVYSGAGSHRSSSLIALLVCLIPTTIGALLSAIGIAGMDRLVQHNVLAMSGRAVEAAGDVTCCCSTRPARSRWQPAGGRVPSRSGRPRSELARGRAALLARRRDARGRSIVVLAEGGVTDCAAELRRPARRSSPFTAQTRMSRRRLRRRRAVRKGAADAVDGVRARAAAARRRGGPARRSTRSQARAALRSSSPSATPAPPCSASIHLEGRRQGGHDGALRPSCAPWASGP